MQAENKALLNQLAISNLQSSKTNTVGTSQEEQTEFADQLLMESDMLQQRKDELHSIDSKFMEVHIKQDEGWSNMVSHPNDKVAPIYGNLVQQDSDHSKTNSSMGKRSRNKRKDYRSNQHETDLTKSQNQSKKGGGLLNQAYMTLMERGASQSRDYDSIFYEFYES